MSGSGKKGTLWTEQHALMQIKPCLNLIHVVSFRQVKGCRFISNSVASISSSQHHNRWHSNKFKMEKNKTKQNQKTNSWYGCASNQRGLLCFDEALCGKKSSARRILGYVTSCRSSPGSAANKIKSVIKWWVVKVKLESIKFNKTDIINIGKTEFQPCYFTMTSQNGVSNPFQVSINPSTSQTAHCSVYIGWYD